MADISWDPGPMGWYPVERAPRSRFVHALVVGSEVVGMTVAMLSIPAAFGAAFWAFSSFVTDMFSTNIFQ